MLAVRHTGAQIVCECLLEQGVHTLFGYPGGAVLPLFDELYRRSELRLIVPAHEQGGAHMADGFARASGTTAVCIATSGPGATNLVTGIATAYMDSTPVVFLTGNVPTYQIGTDAFQEIDITGITQAITKHNWIVKDVRALRGVLRAAFALAREGRPGPVLVDLPRDVQETACEDTEELPPPTRQSGGAPIGESALQKAAALVMHSARPLLLAGGGALRGDAQRMLAALAYRLGAPVATTLMGVSAFPCSDPLSLGLIGQHGTPRMKRALRMCDLIIAVGTRFSDRALPEAPGRQAILHIDIDRAEINKNVTVAQHLLGPADEALRGLLAHLPDEDRAPWAAFQQPTPAKRGFGPRQMLLALREALPPDAIVATDVGQHQLFTAQFFPFEQPRTFLTSGGLGTMGFGLGAAIGAQLACPDRAVALVTGDGSFRMNAPELSTLAGQRLPILILLMDNGSLGMVRQWQTLLCEGRHIAVDIGGAPDYTALAAAYGVEAHDVSSPDALSAHARRCVANRMPMLLRCALRKDQFVSLLR